MSVVEEIKQDLNRGAFKLFAEYRADLYALARDLCGENSADAEDLTMRTLDRAIRRIDLYDEEKGRLGDWMRQIMRNLHKNDLDLKAANSGVSFAPEDIEAAFNEVDTSTEDGILANSDGDYLRKAVDKLPKDLREAVILHYFVDLPIADVARILRVPEGTVKARLHYARKTLQMKLAKEMHKPRTIAAMALVFLSMFSYAAWTNGWLTPSDDEVEEPAAVFETPRIQKQVSISPVSTNEAVAEADEVEQESEDEMSADEEGEVEEPSDEEETTDSAPSPAAKPEAPFSIHIR